ncbi:MAG TPA: AMP-binding protein, partial [Acidimicrobiales bacterium]|nr:AMP-binding protein [Acidimicrobiales bacterium]
MDLGFWALAEQEPGHLALVAPDGTEYKAGELLARVNQTSNALRSMGLKAGDAVATVLPNCPEVFEIYLGALQIGVFLVPINHHLVAAEMAYIITDSETKVFIGHERFAAECEAAAELAGLPAEARLAVGDNGGGISGFTSFASVRDQQSAEKPADRTIGDVMNYTSGTTGKPKGVRRPLTGQSPEDAALGLSGILFLFGIQPREDNVHIVGSPLYHTAVLRFSGASIHFGHTIVLMDKWTPEGM